MYGSEAKQLPRTSSFPHSSNQQPCLESMTSGRYFPFCEFMNLNHQTVLAISLQISVVLCLLDTSYHSRWQEAGFQYVSHLPQTMTDITRDFSHEQQSGLHPSSTTGIIHLPRGPLEDTAGRFCFLEYTPAWRYGGKHKRPRFERYRNWILRCCKHSNKERRTRKGPVARVLRLPPQVLLPAQSLERGVFPRAE